MSPFSDPRGLLLAVAIATALWTPPACAQARADTLVEQARSAARADRNREAADLFARAIEAEPARRGEWLREYADQLTYSGRSRQAVPLYREALASVPDRDGRLRVLKGLGLALLWSDRPGEAVAVYDEVVAIDPDDADAQRNRGRALAWSGRPRHAITVLEPWLAQRHDDAEARRLLAEIRGWTGQPYMALPLLVGVTPPDPDTARLRDRLLRSVRPTSRVELARSSQSDRIDIDQAAFVHEHPLAQGRAMAGVALERLRFAADDGSRAIRIDRPLVLARYRFADAWELNARVGQDRVDVDTGPDHTHFVHATWLTWWPSDRLRFDLSAGRGTFDNLRSLERGLTARTVGLSTDITPNERRRGSLRVERAAFSDGNGRDRVQVLAEQRVDPGLGAWVGARWTALRFDERRDNGYFNPDRLHSPQLTFRMASREHDERRWHVAMESAWGREFVEPGEAQPAWEFALLAGMRVGDDWRLQGGWRRFSTRTSALSGFERTTASLVVQGRW